MDNRLKEQLRNTLFFLKGVEPHTADNFLESLPEAVCFEKGNIVCKPQNGGAALGILIKGRLEILAGCRKVSMRRMESPDVFGAASLFGGDGFVSTVRAATSARVIFVSEEYFKELLTKSFKATENYITFLSDKVRFLNMRIENFTALNATGANNFPIFCHLTRLTNSLTFSPVVF